MKIPVIGGGGREHALAWKIRQSRMVEELFCSPGNAGIAEIADCPPLASSDPDAVADFAARQGIDLTVVGPEAPLVAGVVDRFHAAGLRIFGPTQPAAQIEGSKAFSKASCKRISRVRTKLRPGWGSVMPSNPISRPRESTSTCLPPERPLRKA